MTLTSLFHATLDRRLFHSTHSAQQRPDHALYTLIDWDVVRSGKYAVVDPLDPHSVKYLSNREYIIDSRVAMSNDITLIVLATPSDKPISFIRSDPSDPKNSPPEGEVDEAGFQRFETKRGRRAMLRFFFTTPFINDLLKQGKENRQKAAALKRRKRREFVDAFKFPSGDRPDLLIGDTFICWSTPVKPNKVATNQKPRAPKGFDTLEYLDATRRPRQDVIRKKREEEYLDPMVVLNSRNLVKIIRKWASLVHFRIFGLATAKGFDDGVISFANHLLRIYKHNGIMQVILRLKIYLHATFSYLAGMPLKTTRDLKTPVRLTHGLPSCFPSSTRHAIRAKSVKAIRAWTSICGMYKGLKGKWERPDYTDVIQPDIATLGNQKYLHFDSYCRTAFLLLLPGYIIDGIKNHVYPAALASFKSIDMYVSTKGGPNGKSLTSVHWDLVAWLVIAGHELGYFKDRVILLSSGDLSGEHPFRDFIRWCTLNLDVIFPRLPWGKMILLTKDIRFRHAITKLVFALEDLDLVALANSPGNPITFGYAKDHEDRGTTGVRGPCPEEYEGVLEPLWCRTAPQGGLSVAKLVALYEPAGKVRNIVMVDWLSQQILKPFHDFLFSILKRLPTDATFDQEGKVEEFSKRDLPFIASYDLKAATETISQSLYVAVLSPLIGPEAAGLFVSLLADRDIVISPDADKHRWGRTVKYTRGQPMGALGSWASMALVHHAIVQFAAYTAGVFDRRMFFSDYLVLGDDIIIGNKDVASHYKSICDDLGITIGLPKSFISNGSFLNFANQSFFEKKNISPISFREEIAVRTPGMRIEMAFRMIRRNFISVSGNGWLSPLLRAVLPKQIYKFACVARHKGRLDPAVKAVLAATFGQLARIRSDEFTKEHLEEFQGLSVWGYVRLIKAKVNLFSEPLRTTLGPESDLSRDPGISEVVLGLLHKEAKLLYQSYLRIKPILTNWRQIAVRNEKGRITNPEVFFGPSLSYLSPILVSYRTFGKKLDELLEWEAKYRRPLKTIIVTYSMQPITIELFEYTAGSLETLWDIVDSARRDLPINPDVIVGALPSQGTPKTLDNIFESQEKRFSRFAHMIALSEAVSCEPAFSLRYSASGAARGVILEPTIPEDDTVKSISLDDLEPSEAQ